MYTQELLTCCWRLNPKLAALARAQAKEKRLEEKNARLAAAREPGGVEEGDSDGTEDEGSEGSEDGQEDEEV